MAAKIASLYRRNLFDWFFSLISGFLVLSEFNVKLLSKYGIAKEKIKNKIERGNIYMNAWMAAHKGVHIVIQAFSEAVKKIPEARLNLETKVLDPNYEDKIRRMIRKLKLKDKIAIFERTTVDDYLKRIQSANVVVVAEQWENMAPQPLFQTP